MKPVSYKPKTGRRFRGLEVAQAALLLVLGVVVALALYFTMMNIMYATPAPDVQLNPYYSYVNPITNWGIVVLKFGRTAVVNKVWISNSIGYDIADCMRYRESGPPLTVDAGKEYSFACGFSTRPDTYMTVHVEFADGRIIHIPWVSRG